MPKSEWGFRHRAALPSITVSGQGARVNLGSIDQSVQHFHNQQADHAAVLHALDEILEAIQQTIRSPTDSNDAAVDVEQIKMELQRSKPEKGRIWTLVDRLSSLAGLAEKVAKLTPLLQQLGF